VGEQQRDRVVVSGVAVEHDLARHGALSLLDRRAARSSEPGPKPEPDTGKRDQLATRP
jgi:hypothetical protein